MTAAGFPDVLVQVAFTSQATDTTPSWDDLTGFCFGFETSRGRENADPEQFPPGEAVILLDGTDGEFDPDNGSSPYDGYIRPNRQVRVTATVSATPYVLHTGFADSWRRTWPEGADNSMTELSSTDRFKILARKTVTYSASAEDADARVENLLDAAGVSATDMIINTDTYAARTLIAHPYDGDDAFQAAQDAARADGGQMFVNGTGSVVFQTVAFRQVGGNTRARNSQARFGNDATSLPVGDDLDPTVDDMLMANVVTVTDGAGTVHTSTPDATAEAEDGTLVLDLGATLLDPADAPDRVNDVLNLRKNPTPRYDSLVVDLLTLSSADQATVLGLEISDRITVAVIPPGQAAGTERDQWIESIAHEVEMGRSWMVTFGLSSAGDSVTVIP